MLFMWPKRLVTAQRRMGLGYCEKDRGLRGQEWEQAAQPAVDRVFDVMCLVREVQ